jgi:hypothetical protein
MTPPTTYAPKPAALQAVHDITMQGICDSDRIHVTLTDAQRDHLVTECAKDAKSEAAFNTLTAVAYPDEGYRYTRADWSAFITRLLN